MLEQVLGSLHWLRISNSYFIQLALINANSVGSVFLLYDDNWRSVRRSRSPNHSKIKHFLNFSLQVLYDSIGQRIGFRSNWSAVSQRDLVLNDIGLPRYIGEHTVVGSQNLPDILFLIFGQPETQLHIPYNVSFSPWLPNSNSSSSSTLGLSS